MLSQRLAVIFLYNAHRPQYTIAAQRSDKSFEHLQRQEKRQPLIRKFTLSKMSPFLAFVLNESAEAQEAAFDEVQSKASRDAWLLKHGLHSSQRTATEQMSWPEVGSDGDGEEDNMSDLDIWDQVDALVHCDTVLPSVEEEGERPMNVNLWREHSEDLIEEFGLHAHSDKDIPLDEEGFPVPCLPLLSSPEFLPRSPPSDYSWSSHATATTQEHTPAVAWERTHLESLSASYPQTRPKSSAAVAPSPEYRLVSPIISDAFPPLYTATITPSPLATAPSLDYGPAS